jgi:signal recognition particle GTPase
MKAWITVGVSCSAKTTWANEQVAQRRAERGTPITIVCRDDIRRAMQNGYLNWRTWSWKNEDKVSDLHTKMIEEAAQRKNDIIVADTNLNEKRRKQIITKLESLGY